MGVLTGPCSKDIFNVDLDKEDWWQQQLAIHNNGSEIETPCYRTGGGGRQLLFRAPRGWIPPTCRTPMGVDIRGRGGFAMLPPSIHESGKRYEWVEGKELWAIPIAEAPEWLCREIDKLATAHAAGGPGGPADALAGPRVVTAAHGDSDRSALGLRVDGREDYMTRLIWGAIVDMRRASPIKPCDLSGMGEAYSTYEQNVKSRIEDPTTPKSELLEREGRGMTLFRFKWERALEQWDGKVAEAAKKGGAEVGRIVQGENWQDVQKPVQDTRQWLYTSTAFVAEFVPPDYLIHGVIQKGYIYSLTAATGTGKTAVLLMLAAHVDQGAPIGGRKVKRGKVLYLAGENPNDVRMRWFAQTQQLGLTPEDMSNTIFMPLVTALSTGVERIRQELEVNGDELALVIVDTAAAYSEAADENANVDQRRQAQILRQLLSLPGGPAVIVACHPPKNHDPENPEPRGGGAFIAEIDGNLCMRKGEGALEFHHTPKFRGADFPPMHFELRTVTHERLKDGDGNLILTVVAHYIGDIEREGIRQATTQDEDLVLAELRRDDSQSLRNIAEVLGWRFKNGAAAGQPDQSKVKRTIAGLQHDGLVKRFRRRYTLTEKGLKEARK